MSLNTTAPTFAALQVVTASDLNTITDGIQAAWDAYTPTVGGWTLGNGVVAAAYRQVGKTYEVRVKVTVGTTTVAAASMTLTLPVAPHADWASAARWFARDVSAPASEFGDADITGSTTINLRATNPFTWASTDYIGISFFYEAA